MYACCTSKPIHELLNPNKHDITSAYEREFLYMTDHSVALQELEMTRDHLIAWIRKNLSEQEREFIFSIKQGQPKYDLLPFAGLENFPALQWKLKNIAKIEKDKHTLMLKKLADFLSAR